MKNTLVVFYSHTGSNRYLASRIAQALQADIEEIRPWFSWFYLLLFSSSLKLCLGIRRLKQPPGDYEKVKEEYEKISEKVTVLEKEKQDILDVIADIDKKKKITFMKTFDSINEMFSSNFLRLGAREAFLSLENRENPFEGGVNIDVKLAKGKYLDVNSLSGGERTLVALSLIFAIQELKPYNFYIFDEIDAALDKKNTERLSDLLRTYIKNAQYIVITHNDHLISDSPVLFGVSMQDGVSKVLSLRV